MKSRKNYLKARKKQFQWSYIGWVVKDSICPICSGSPLVLIDQYDAWACISCNEWLDKACDDPDCPIAAFDHRLPMKHTF